MPRSKPWVVLRRRPRRSGGGPGGGRRAAGRLGRWPTAAPPSTLARGRCTTCSGSSWWAGACPWSLRQPRSPWAGALAALRGGSGSSRPACGPLPLRLPAPAPAAAPARHARPQRLGVCGPSGDGHGRSHRGDGRAGPLPVYLTHRDAGRRRGLAYHGPLPRPLPGGRRPNFWRGSARKSSRCCWARGASGRA